MQAELTEGTLVWSHASVPLHPPMTVLTLAKLQELVPSQPPTTVGMTADLQAFVPEQLPSRQTTPVKSSHASVPAQH